VADHRDTVRAMYQAFQRGDIPAVLDRLAPDVRWEDWPDHHAQKAGVPWLKPLRGRDAVVQFFQLIGGYKFHRFDVLAVMGGPTHACGLIAVDIELPTGKRFTDEEMHLFEFNEKGQVVLFRHYVDTAKAMAVSTSGEPAA
jgi:ketosteroid isomerase-like protein